MDMGSVQELAQFIDSSSTEEMQLLDEESDIDQQPIETPHTSVFRTNRPSRLSNFSDLDEVSLAKSSENVAKITSPIQRSATFTISKSKEQSSATNEVDLCEHETPSRPMSTATNASIEIGGYQNAIENVLTLLLEAEEVLSKDLPSVTGLTEAKVQFEEHEDFMIKLSTYQQYVGGALEEGARLIAESQMSFGLSNDDQSEIKHQMFLLNERWETLRMRALSIQSRVHATLAQVQLEKIDELRHMLTATEDRISRMEEVSGHPEQLAGQQKEQVELERDLDAQKVIVDGLSNLVVIVNDDLFSDFEDKLNALGERWAHVLKWTKQRGDRLHEVDHSWTVLNSRYKLVAHWMDSREHDLKAMERTEVTEIGNVMKRMNDLKYCGKDLEVLSDYLGDLEIMANGIGPASTSIIEQLENLGDRCDALKQILEIQQTRIEGLGFKFPEPQNRNALERPESWYDFQGRFNMDSSQHEDAVLDKELSQQLSNKKRKLQKPERIRFLEGQIQEMLDFVYNIERTIDSLNECESPQQKASLLKYIAEDIANKIREFPEIKSVLEECQQLKFDDLSEEERQISDIGSKYDELNFKVEDLTSSNNVAVSNEKLLASMTAFKLVLADCRDWFKQTSNKAALEDLENRLAHMESLTPEIEGAKEQWTVAAGAIEGRQDFDQFCDSWQDLKNAIVRLIQERGGVPKDNRVNVLRLELEDFISEAEETYVLISEVTHMHNNLKTLNELKKRYSSLAENYVYVSDKLSRSSESEDLTDVWEKLPNLINERIIKQTTAIENLNHFKGEFDSIKQILTRLEQNLREDVFIPGDLSALHIMTDEYERYGRDIKKIEIDIISVRNFSEIIVRDSEDDHKNAVLKQVGTLSSAYTRCIDVFQANSKRLHQVIQRTEDVIQRIDQTELWLNDLEMNTPQVTNSEIANSNELFQVKSRFQALKETCEQRSDAFRELNEVGGEMLVQIDEHNSGKVGTTHLAKQFTKLNARWNAVTAQVYNRTAFLEHIFGQLGEFKTLMVSEIGYLDRLEKCLRKSPETAADAEEIYEELDVSKLDFNNLGNIVAYMYCRTLKIISEITRMTGLTKSKRSVPNSLNTT